MVPPRAHLDPIQSYQVLTKPEVLLHFAGRLAEHHADLGHGEVRIYADVHKSVNGKPFQRFVDPRVDLASVEGMRWFADEPWLLRPEPSQAAPGLVPDWYPRSRPRGSARCSTRFATGSLRAPSRPPRAVRGRGSSPGRPASDEPHRTPARHRDRHGRYKGEGPHPGGRRAMSRTWLLAAVFRRYTAAGADLRERPRASRIGDTWRPGPWRAGVLALLVAAASASAAEPAATRELELTLEEAIRLALANNRSLERARLGRETDRLSLELAEERYRPRASVEASARTDSGSPASAELSVGPRMRVPTGGEFSLRWSEPVGGGTDGSGTWTLGFSQPLLQGFGHAIDTAPVRLARIREKTNVLSFRDAVASTVESVIQAYRRVIRVHRAIAISRESLARARKQLEINRSLIRAGRMAEREIVQSESEIANRELALVESENGLSSADASLLSILDLDGVSRVVPVDETLAVEPLRPDPEQSIETAFANRTDYLGAQSSREVATIELNRARNDQLWDLRLTANVSRGSGDGRDYGAAVGLSIPLGERTSRKLALMQAKHALRGAEIALVELRQSIRSDVRQAVHDVEIGLRRIELARRARELAEEQLEVERSKLTQGLTSAYQLTSVEDGLVRAQNGELSAIVSYSNAVVSLDRALGTTLRSWGIEVEEVESGSDDFRGGGAGLGTVGRETRLTMGAPVAGHRAVAASDSGRPDDEWPVLEPPRRAVEAAKRALAAAWARTGELGGGRVPDGSLAEARARAVSAPHTGGPARQRRSLLLSLGEFEPETIAVREALLAASGGQDQQAATPVRIVGRDAERTLALRPGFEIDAAVPRGDSRRDAPR